jgi:RelA/SpoT family (p)ppGpp synthetase
MEYREDLLNTIKKTNNNNLNIDKIITAYEFAKEAHLGQFRRSGEGYIAHPVAVAKILIELYMDTDTIIAGLLHDVIEDTMISKSDIIYNFGEVVAELVDGVTKLKNLPEGTKKQHENIRKMIVSMAKDVRVVIIKLADRLHNMRTLKFMKPEKQISIAKETLNIFAPLAHRLGIAKIKWELEDLAFSYLHPEIYRQIVELVNSKRREREEYTEGVLNFLKEELKKYNINGEVSGRVKHFYSIYKKMYEKGKSFEELYDLTALRIIVDSKADCYNCLGIIHNIWIPVPGRFKDYIAVPKANGYQSIHTTVVGPNGKYIEIQIRTHEMHKIAEEGIAAHWAYKEKIKTNRRDNIYSWLRNILEWQNEAESSEEFINTVTGDILNDTVFVFSPKGDVIELANGSTPLDFAFHIHTQIGYKCIGAKVNNKMVPLDYKLKNGDQVEIITSKSAKGPGKDWLNIVVTHSAKSKIKKWIKDREFEENYKLGKSLVEKELLKYNLKLKDVENSDITKEFIKRQSLPNFDDLLFQIGIGRIPLDTFISKFKPLEEENVEENLEEILDKNNRKIRSNDDNAIVIDGTDNTLVRFAKCCTPLPGDEVDGYVTRGQGITVHIKTCKNLIALKNKEPERIIPVKWNESIVKNKFTKFIFNFTIIAYDRNNLLKDIINLLSDSKMSLLGVNTHSYKNNGEKYAKLHLTIELNEREQFNRLTANLEKIKGIISVKRDV